MIDFFEKTKGSISLFLALIMLPMMTVAGLIVDGARISAAKASLSGAGDLAMNAALSEYDQILYDVYFEGPMGNLQGGFRNTQGGGVLL